MRLPPHLRVSFRDAYRESFGADISLEEVERFAIPLLRVMVIILRRPEGDDVHRSSSVARLTGTPMDESVCRKP